MILLNNSLSDYAFNYEKRFDCHISNDFIYASYHPMMEAHEYYNLVLLPDEYSMIGDHFG